MTKVTAKTDPKKKAGSAISGGRAEGVGEGQPAPRAKMALTRGATPRIATVDRREQIVSVALELLAQTSIESLTTRDLATAMGLTQPALFRHFRNREALLVGVVEHARAQLEKTAVAIFSAGGRAVEQLSELGAALLEHAERQPGLPRLLFASTTESAGEVREALRGVVAMQQSVVAELVRQGQREGEIDRAIDAGAAATLFVGMLQGLILRWEMGGRGEALAAKLTPVFAVWLRGAMPREGDGGVAATQVGGDAGPGVARGAIVALDVRPLLERGVEPLGVILEALDGLPKAGVLVVEAPFRPAPLITLLKRRGHAVQVEALGAQHWILEVVVGGEPDVEDLRDLEAAAVVERLGAAAALEAEAVFIARVRGGVPRGLGALLKRRDVKVDSLERSDGVTVVRLSRG